MSDVIAVLERKNDPKVLNATHALANLLSVGTRRLQVPAVARQRQLDDLVTALGAHDVEAAVISAQTPNPLCWDVMQRVAIPLLVVPRHSDRVTKRISEVLLPLDGTQETAASVSHMAERMTSAGARVLAMHVFDPTTVPAFWDQAAHAHEHWTEEFRQRNLPPAVDLNLRRGHTAEEVLAEARRAAVDLIMIGWGQSFSGGRARTVHGALTDGLVPVLLLSTVPGPSAKDEGPSALPRQRGDEGT